MRTIRFRGKRLDNGEWAYGLPVPVATRNKKELYIVSSVRGGSVYGFAVDPKTVGQDTGLTDKNGNEVYEGDIVRYRLTDERFKKNPRFANLPISYDEKSAAFEAGNIYWTRLWSPRLEVIGNIHDNPELVACTKEKLL